MYFSATVTHYITNSHEHLSSLMKCAEPQDHAHTGMRTNHEIHEECKSAAAEDR